jgi:ATP-dependent helicase HrpA
VSTQPLDFQVDSGLPISAYAHDIAQLIRDHQVVVVAGETGSGKTTQLPKICLGLGHTRIGHTQPRRIAARSVATRIAQEIGTPLGDLVGYQVRFTTTASTQTRLKLMTDGIMLSEISQDRLLKRYDTIIIDEAHERSLNIDFLLGYLKQLLPKRPDLKVIITSATIDTARFSAHFGNAPIVEVSGRGYPVEILYTPLGDDDDPMQAIVDAIKGLPREGDVLVFCIGEREIKDADKAIRDAKLGVEVLPLYARLTMEEQAKVFAPHGGQRVVLATNVAETSLTVPGIRYVVDPGFARISRYSARTKVQRLPIESISQASANQRAGRCGRVAPGICVRLYSQADFDSREKYTEPEILRTNLASVILAMANARLGDIADFPFVEPPDRGQVHDGLRLLTELGAISGEGRMPRLTGLGRKMANLPVDPRLARMLLESGPRGCLKEVLTIVAALSIQDVRERPQDKREEADSFHARFTTVGPDSDPPDCEPKRTTAHTGWKNRSQNSTDIGGDFSALLRLWEYLQIQRKQLSSSQFRRMCRAEYLNYLRVREWQDLVTQLREATKQMKLTTNRVPAQMSEILTSCMAGLLSNIGAIEPDTRSMNQGRRRGPRTYLGTRGSRFAISPGSVLAKATPELVVAVELIETTRLWAHMVAAITAEQVEEVGAHMLQRSYSEPFFATSTGTVLAYEKISLLGVVLVAERRVGFSRIDPDQARAIFIQTGLVEGLALPRAGTPYWEVAEHNGVVKKQIEDLEDKARRRGVLVDDAEVFEFFNTRIPAGISSLSALDKWLRADPRNKTTLLMGVDDLLGRDSQVSEEAYPDTWVFGETDLGLDYHFSPGDFRDGVTVTVPLATLSSLDPAPFTWGVPGSRHDLATALIRTLPKSMRTRFVPAPDWATKALAWLKKSDADHTKPFTEELDRALHALTGETITGWDPQALPDHLRMGFLVTTGQSTQYSRDLETLQSDLSRQVLSKLEKSSTRKRESGTTWVFGSMPENLSIKDHGVTVTGYPCLKDEVTQVSEVLFTSLDQAQSSHRQGLARLIGFNLPEPYKWVIAHLSNQDKIALGSSPYPSVPDLLADARFVAVTNLISGHDTWAVRDEPTFTEMVTCVRPDQVDSTHATVLLAAESLRIASGVHQLLAKCDQNSYLVQDTSSQIDSLIFNGFLHVFPTQWLARVPTWLRGIEMRIKSAMADPRRDESRMEQMDPVLDAYAELMDAHPQSSQEIDRIGYLIEEFRLQVFAQSLRTIETVSSKRILKAMAEL